MLNAAGISVPTARRWPADEVA